MPPNDRSKKLFALDQGFPVPIVAALARYTPEAHFVHLHRIHPAMSNMQDWELLHALHCHSEPWDGLVTTDARLLALAKVMAVLTQTRLTLVATKAAGHDALKATGLVLAHITNICKNTVPSKAQVWELSTAAKAPNKPMRYLATIAARQGRSIKELLREERLSQSELATSPLGIAGSG